MAPRFVILNPCSKRWRDLPGDGRKRFCPDCQTHIHALDHYSEEEIADLRRESPWRLCGSLAGEGIVQPRSRRAVLVGAMLTAISPLMAQSGRIRIRVIDATGAVIPSAEASLLGSDGKPVSTAHADERGEIVLTHLPIGDSKIIVMATGFYSLTLTAAIPNEDETNVDANLQAIPCACDPVHALFLKKKRRWWWPFP